MKIKVVLVTKDAAYSDRLKKRLLSHYYNNVQLSVYSDSDTAAVRAKELRPDIFLLDDEFDYEAIDLPKRCSLAVLVAERGIGSISGIPAVAKYQSAADIVAALNDIFVRRAEADGVRFVSRDDLRKRIISFFPCAGGVGSSTLAAAYALSLAQSGEKVLYLNLERLGAGDMYFSGGGIHDFDKVLYALQMNSSSTTLKLESALSRDANGVYFYSAATSALDMEELDDGRTELLFDALSRSELFDWIVADCDFSLDLHTFQQIERSDASVFVSDGSTVANEKLKRLSNALELKLTQNDSLRLLLMYNRFSSRSSVKAQDTMFTEAGGVGRIENAATSELLEIISKSGSFSDITSSIGV